MELTKNSGYAFMAVNQFVQAVHYYGRVIERPAHKFMRRTHYLRMNNPDLYKRAAWLIHQLNLKPEGMGDADEHIFSEYAQAVTTVLHYAKNFPVETKAAMDLFWSDITLEVRTKVLHLAVCEID